MPYSRYNAGPIWSCNRLINEVIARPCPREWNGVVQLSSLTDGCIKCLRHANTNMYSVLNWSWISLEAGELRCIFNIVTNVSRPNIMLHSVYINRWLKNYKITWKCFCSNKVAQIYLNVHWAPLKFQTVYSIKVNVWRFFLFALLFCVSLLFIVWGVFQFVWKISG